MLGTPAQTPEPSHLLAIASRITATCKRAVQWIPAKARLATLVGSLVLIGLVLYTSLSGGTATLNLVCRHDLQSADLSVVIDGKLSYTDHISAGPKKLLRIFGKRVLTFSKSLAVPSGKHVIEVHLSSAADGFDQTKQCEFNLHPGSEATLVITAERSEMSLVYEGSPIAPAQNLGSGYSDSLRSILVTVIGSAVSAAIGFFVQEILRSRKSA